MSSRIISCFPLILATAIALPAVAANPPAPDEFSMRCRVLDPVTRKSKTEFLPGEGALVTGQLRVGSDAMQQAVNVAIFARVNVSGFGFQTRIGDGTIDVPDKATRQTIDGWEDQEAKVPDEFARSFSYAVTLPTKLPAGKLKLEAIATIDGFGERKCSKTIEVL